MIYSKKTMNKFLISDDKYSFGYGYCGVILTDLDSINDTLNNILCFNKIITTHHRFVEGVQKEYEDTITYIEHKKYYIHSYLKPDNYLNRLEWNNLTIDEIKGKNYKYYTEILYDKKILYIGLLVSFENLIKNVELYVTHIKYDCEVGTPIYDTMPFDLKNNKIIFL